MSADLPMYRARSHWKDRPDCPTELRQFAGKRIIPVLAGRVVKSMDGLSQEYLEADWRHAGVSLYLPNGDAYGDFNGDEERIITRRRSSSSSNLLFI